MTDLPDFNVWLALVDENHPHHQRSRDYWQNQSSSEIAFFRVPGRDDPASVVPNYPAAEEDSGEAIH
jgi:hypothetical protein